MKLNFGKKAVLFLHWLFALLISIAAAFCYIAPETANGINEKLVQQLGRNKTTIIVVILFAIYLVLAVYTVLMLFHNKEKREERGYIIINNAEQGTSRIALSAIDQMVKQSVKNIAGVSDVKTTVNGQHDSVAINALVSVQNGAHVPTVSANVQNAIRSYIELNSGVTVREVCVSINALDVSQDAPEAVMNPLSLNKPPVEDNLQDDGADPMSFTDPETKDDGIHLELGQDSEKM